MNLRIVYGLMALSLVACGGGDSSTGSGSGGGSSSSSASSGGEGGSGGAGGDGGASVSGSGGSGGAGVGGGGGSGGAGVGGGGGSGGAGVGGSGGGEAQTCGGFVGAACPETMFCDFPDGQCGFTDGSGVCAPRDGACDVTEPVCGCDGQVYPSQCEARSRGVDEADASHCPKPKACGGHTGGSCAADEYCDYPDNQCGALDGGGVCRPREGACATAGEVCACDGEKYASACEAQKAGVDVSVLTPCE